ncbi:AbrB/MazE/SpoVT family DNA-binding domain-containing protein [Chamaesiphon sp.]|uniref:AbrB/MazE/SpoVT family DNA-binding domain-containing protein n=1 Tax=Chamaesiphon sp. TaxID=2814140 RepID=UPI003593F698
MTITLSAEILQKLQVGEGDTILAIETTNGIELVAGDPGFESGMAAYRKVASKYSNALQELAE